MKYIKEKWNLLKSEISKIWIKSKKKEIFMWKYSICSIIKIFDKQTIILNSE